MFIYVIHDLLYERVVCVHDTPNWVCNSCDKKKYRERYAYQLYDFKRKVKKYITKKQLENL